MAAAEPKSISVDASIIICPVCTEIFTEPRMLECGHSYCTRCLKRVKSYSKEISCPTCRRLSTAKDVESLPINFSILAISESRTADDGQNLDALSEVELLVKKQKEQVKLDRKRISQMITNVAAEAREKITAEESEQLKRLEYVFQIKMKRLSKLEKVKLDPNDPEKVASLKKGIENSKLGVVFYNSTMRMKFGKVVSSKEAQKQIKTAKEEGTRKDLSNDKEVIVCENISGDCRSGNLVSRKSKTDICESDQGTIPNTPPNGVCDLSKRSNVSKEVTQNVVSLSHLSSNEIKGVDVTNKEDNISHVEIKDGSSKENVTNIRNEVEGLSGDAQSSYKEELCITKPDIKEELASNTLGENVGLDKHSQTAVSAVKDENLGSPSFPNALPPNNLSEGNVLVEQGNLGNTDSKETNDSAQFKENEPVNGVLDHVVPRQPIIFFHSDDDSDDSTPGYHVLASDHNNSNYDDREHICDDDHDNLGLLDRYDSDNEFELRCGETDPGYFKAFDEHGWQNGVDNFDNGSDVDQCHESDGYEDQDGDFDEWNGCNYGDDGYHPLDDADQDGRWIGEFLVLDCGTNEDGHDLLDGCYDHDDSHSGFSGWSDGLQIGGVDGNEDDYICHDGEVIHVEGDHYDFSDGWGNDDNDINEGGDYICHDGDIFHDEGGNYDGFSDGCENGDSFGVDGGSSNWGDDGNLTGFDDGVPGGCNDGAVNVDFENNCGVDQDGFNGVDNFCHGDEDQFDNIVACDYGGYNGDHEDASYSYDHDHGDGPVFGDNDGYDGGYVYDGDDGNYGYDDYYGGDDW